MSLPSQAPSAVIGTVSLSALLEGTAKVGIEIPAGFPVGQDVQIDGFVADIEEVRSLQIAGDLLGAPIKSKKRIDQGKILISEALIPSRAAPAPPSSTVSLERTVTPIIALISLYLTIDRATMATEDASNL